MFKIANSLKLCDLVEAVSRALGVKLYTNLLDSVAGATAYTPPLPATPR
jgi:hypothetical protein